MTKKETKAKEAKPRRKASLMSAVNAVMKIAGFWVIGMAEFVRVPTEIVDDISIVRYRLGWPDLTPEQMLLLERRLIEIGDRNLIRDTLPSAIGAMAAKRKWQGCSITGARSDKRPAQVTVRVANPDVDVAHVAHRAATWSRWSCVRRASP